MKGSAIKGQLDMLVLAVLAARPLHGYAVIEELKLRSRDSFDLPEGRGWAIALAGLDAIVGIVILAWPGIGLATLAVFFAITMLFKGVFAIVLGVKLRSLRHAEEPPPVHHATLAT